MVRRMYSGPRRKKRTGPRPEDPILARFVLLAVLCFSLAVVLWYVGFR